MENSPQPVTLDQKSPGNSNKAIAFVLVGCLVLCCLVICAVVAVVVLILPNTRFATPTDFLPITLFDDKPGDADNTDTNNPTSSSGKETRADFYLTNSDGKKFAFYLPVDWKLSSDQRFPNIVNPCYMPGSYQDVSDCDVVALYNVLYPDEYGYQVAFSTPGMLHWAGGSVPTETVKERVDFLGEQINASFEYMVTTEDMDPAPVLLNLCNTNGICFSADLKNIPDDGYAYPYSLLIKELWEDTKVTLVK